MKRWVAGCRARCRGRGDGGCQGAQGGHDAPAIPAAAIRREPRHRPAARCYDRVRRQRRRRYEAGCDLRQPGRLRGRHRLAASGRHHAPLHPCRHIGTQRMPGRGLGRPRLPARDIGHVHPDRCLRGQPRLLRRPNFRGGFKFDISQDSGVHMPIEIAYEPSVGMNGLPGHYMIGFGYDSSSTYRNFAAAPSATSDGGSGTPIPRHGGNTRLGTGRPDAAASRTGRHRRHRPGRFRP